MAQDPGVAVQFEAPEWSPESPFLQDVALTRQIAPPAAAPSLTMEAAPSPFVAEYEGDTGVHGADAEAFAATIAELHDPEFGEALTDLVHEAAALAEERFAFETTDLAALRAEQVRGLRDYVEPLAVATEAALDEMIRTTGSRSLTGLTDSEVDALLESVTPPTPPLPPAFEQFFKKIVAKAKKAVKAVSKVTNVLMPHKLVLGRLKGLVRPLLERVLRLALGKLPVALQPIAKQLAKRFLGVSLEHETADDEEAEGEAASGDPEDLEAEFDAQLAGVLLRGEDFDREAAVERFVAESAGGDPLAELDAARDAFARTVTTLPPGSDPTPAVQQFAPAILAALKIGIKIIGRPKVVDFLAGLVAKLITKYVGAQAATALSRALVDTGLKLVGLEVPEQAAGRALAATVEDTIVRALQAAPPEALDQPALLESYVQEAFEQAAAAHFPDALIRTELHETADAPGAWVPRGRRPRYKKYSRVLAATITPQQAAAVTSFGDASLRDELRDRLGVDVRTPVAAQLHLYEVMAGGTLADIARGEAEAGFGRADRAGWTQLHPLTPEAAAVLLREPKLGRTVPPQFLARRGAPALGQRLYALSVPGARPRLMRRASGTGQRPARTSRLRVTLDFPKSEVRVAVYYSESEAQRIAGLIRRQAPPAVLLAALRAGLADRLTRLFSGRPTRALRLIHESVPVDQFRSPVVGRVIAAIGAKVRPVVERALLAALAERVAGLAAAGRDFVTAADADADGVTLECTFAQVPFLAPLRALLRGNPLAALRGLGDAARQKLGEVRVTIRAGFALR